MKTKLLMRGTNEEGARVVLAIELFAEKNKVTIHVIPNDAVDGDLDKQLSAWRANEPTETPLVFPESTQIIERDLAVVDSILPEGYKVDREDVVNRTQNEWQFMVLSAKLHEAYKSELAELSDKVNQLTDYSGELWGALKGFWDKVQGQVKDRTLFREHANTLRDTTNDLFEQMKGMRSTAVNDFEAKSNELWDKFNTQLDDIERRIGEGIQRLPELFEELKATQTEFRGNKLTKEQGNKIWDRLDVLFKSLKEKRFGDNAINDNSATERIQRRHEGLLEAIKKMEESIRRDNADVEFLTKRADRAMGQLEDQLRKAKVNLIVDRVKSKQEKLNEMIATRDELEGKLQSMKERDQKRADRPARTDRPERQRMDKPSVVAAVPVVVETSVDAPIVAAIVEETVVETPEIAPVVEETVVEMSEIVPVVEEKAVETPEIAPIVEEKVEEVVETPVEKVEMAPPPVVAPSIDVETVASVASSSLDAVAQVTEMMAAPTPEPVAVEVAATVVEAVEEKIEEKIEVELPVEAVKEVDAPPPPPTIAPIDDEELRW